MFNNIDEIKVFFNDLNQLFESFQDFNDLDRTEFNLFDFLYLTVRESKLMLMKTFFIATSVLEIVTKLKFLLKTTLFVRFTQLEEFLLRTFFIIDKIVFFCFRFFKIRTNYFNKNFYEILQAKKIFLCSVKLLYINFPLAHLIQECKRY